MKVLRISDIHVSPNWIEESTKDVKRICEIAKAEKVDVITSSGDFFHKAIMASDKNNWNDVLNLARMLQEAAQVVYINGTPSHDSPGCYSSFKDIGWIEVNAGVSHKIGNLLITGLQEITPAFLMAKYPDMSKGEIIDQQYSLVNSLIDEYYSPLIANHNGNSLFMTHGHLAGAKFKDDQKPRSSEFMFSIEMLKRINADSVQLGHLHLPQHFPEVNADYIGSSHLTWGDTGFKAGFDIVEFDSHGEIEKTRYDYDKPERQKIVVEDAETINHALKAIKKDVDLWIDVKCDKEFADQFDCNLNFKIIANQYDIGSLSKITLNIQHLEHIRVDTEEYEKAKTEEDLYKIYNPDASKSLISKVNEIERETETETGSTEKHNFEFLDLYLRGSKAGLENGVEEIKVDWDDFQNGINLLTGKNGTGKSFILGFCNPFSEHLPTGSDLKSLFELKDSQVVRRFKDGKDIITQKIIIDPTLANPTAKYYMDINGTPVVNVTGNKKPFDDAVNDIFGSIKMFMACTFRGQKDNPNYPSLEKAKESDLRQIYTELAGINKAHMKKYAHDKAVELKREIELDSREIETLESLLVDVDEKNVEIVTNGIVIAENNTHLVNANKALESLKNDIAKIDAVIIGNDGVNEQIKSLVNLKYTLIQDNHTCRAELKTVLNSLNNADSIKGEIEELKSKQVQHTEASSKYFEAQNRYNTILDQWNIQKDKTDNALEEIVNKSEPLKTELRGFENNTTEMGYHIENYERQIKELNIPCEHCGKLSSTAGNKIEELEGLILDRSNKIKTNNDLIRINNDEVEKLREEYSTIKSGLTEKPIESFEIKMLKKQMDDLKPDTDRINNLQLTIDNLKSTENRKIELEIMIKSKSERLEEITNQIEALNSKIIDVDTENYQTLKQGIDYKTDAIAEYTTEIATLTAKIETLKDSLAENNNRVVKIKTIKEGIDKTQLDITEWEELTVAYSPKGIEALELSLLVPLIDRKANELLNLNNSRFRIETITQDLDSTGKKVLERFKILVHDSMSNEVKELTVLSGGQLVWVVSALREAISDIASQKYGRIFDYKILDESDAALDSDIIIDYYSMMERLNDSRKVVAVSHSSEAKNAIENTKEITDFMIRYGG